MLTRRASEDIGAQTTLIAAAVLGAGITFAALLLPGMRAVEGRESSTADVEPAAGHALAAS